MKIPDRVRAEAHIGTARVFLQGTSVIPVDVYVLKDVLLILNDKGWSHDEIQMNLNEWKSRGNIFVTLAFEFELKEEPNDV